MNWQPIQSAPVNKEVLVYDPFWGYMAVANQWDNGEWWEADDRCHHPTHWMPLPEPPEDC